jgi:Cu+-exporting ATPase
MPKTAVPKTAAPTTAAPTTVDLEIEGMTCASCATRIERKLNKLDGVVATVNYATAKARVQSETASTAQLISAVEAAGYRAALPANQNAEPNTHAPASGLRRLAVSAILAAPVVLLSMIPLLQFTGWQWVALVLATPVVVWGAWPFHRTAFVSARHGSASMDTLISVGVIAAYGWSLYALIFGTAGQPGMHMTFSFLASAGYGASEIYLEVASAVTVFILTGRYLEARASVASGAALKALLSLGAKQATLLRGQIESPVDASALLPGDTIVVRPGEKIAADGIVIDGVSAVDRSLLSGESMPVSVRPGDTVIGATINVGGRLVVEVTRVGADTELARMGGLVEEAQTGKAQVQRLADRVSAVFVPIVIGLAIVTFIAWILLGGSLEAAFTAAIATLIIACPCALGLATPTALLVGTGRGAQLGILLRGPQVLEQTRTIDTIVLDKTGTVTSGKMRVISVTPASGVATEHVLKMAAAAELGSEHPIGRAIVSQAREAGLPIAAAQSFTAHAGAGVEALVDGVVVVVGRPEWMLSAWSIDASNAEAQQSTVMAVAWDGEFRGTIAVGDTVKATSLAAITRFRELGLHPILLTGDNAFVANAVAGEVGIDEVHAAATPADKLALIRSLQAAGHIVAMVGDGVNDAAALAAANLGIAMGTGTDTAISASDITVIGGSTIEGDLLVVADAVRLARATLGTIKGNLFWAFAYNVAAIPIAMLGLLNPLFAGAAMAFSSVFVVTNSLRLRRFKAAPFQAAPFQAAPLTPAPRKLT